MLQFYGIYLQNTKLSTAFDVIRFLGEPDSIRFSHITLRGPYRRKLSKSWLHQTNGNQEYSWCVRLVEPGKFFSNTQFTVIIGVNLMSLNKLVHKPNFRDSVPHLTLYDGDDRDFGENLCDLVSNYDWEQVVRVSRIREIESKHKIDEVFLSFFLSFNNLFQEFVGDVTEIPYVKQMPSKRRLSLIEKILVGYSEKLSEPRLKGL